MSFLLPAALLGGILVLVPLLLHLFRGEPVREESFPALRHLLNAGRNRTRALRLRELLLLLFRVGAVVLATLAAARWVLPLGEAHHPPAHLVVVLENGSTSASVVEGTRLLDAQRALAAPLLDRLGPLDRIWVLPATDPSRPARPLPPEEARAALEALEPERAPPRVDDAVARGRAILATAGEAPGGILVLRSHGGRLEENRGGGITEVDPGLPLPSNHGIVEVVVNEGRPPRAGEPVEVRVQVAARAGTGDEVQGAPSPPSLEGRAVRLLQDGVLRVAGQTDASGEARLLLPPPETPAGEPLLLRVELDPDALRLDDSVELPLRLDPLPRVQVAGTPGRWVEAALATLEEAGWLVQTRTGALPGWATRLPPGSGALLTDRTLLLLPPDDPVHLAAFHRTLEELLPAGPPLRGTLISGRGTRPLSAPPELQVLEGVGVERWYRWSGAPDALLPGSTRPPASPEPSPGSGTRAGAQSDVRAGVQGGVQAGVQAGLQALLLDDGSPLVTQRITPAPADLATPDPEPAAGGAPSPPVVRLLAVPLVPRWSELPLSAAMVPLVDQLLRAPDSPALATSLPPLATPLPGAAPDRGWEGTVLPPRGGREASPFLAWLLVVILLVEGWLSLSRRAAPRTELETSPQS